MIGIDTNIIVRLLTEDDEPQFLKARHIFSTEQIFIADTVLLETEWVLRFAYKFKPDEIRQALTKLLGLENVHVNRPENLAEVLKLYGKGLDFADAMHLTASSRYKVFLTFDKAFLRRTGGWTKWKVREP
ncbi:type II toxin-antitoxin system VapC family toxin [Thermodesulfobacteriota bacterium B35]